MGVTLTNQTNHFRIKPVHWILLFGLAQLALAFLTDGFGFSFDEAMWGYIGRNWFRHGLVPYHGGVDNKSPLIFAIFGLSDKLFGVNYWFPRVLGTICQSAGLWYLYRIAKHIAGVQAALLAMILYGLSLLWHGTGGKYVSYTETYAVTSIIIAFYTWLIAKKRSDFFISGLLAALGTAFRISGFFGALALLISSMRRGTRTCLFFLSGFLTGMLLFILFLYFTGINIHDFIIYAFADNFGSGSPTDHKILWKLQNFFDAFFYSELILFYPAAIGYFFIKKRIDFLSLWMICEFIGISAVGFYSHQHFKNILPAFSLMNAVSIAYLIEVYKMPAMQVMTVVGITFFPKIIEPFVGLKKLFVPPADKSAICCREPYPPPDTDAQRKLGLWIRTNTTDEERVLVAGYGAQVQVYTERLSPTIYFNITQTQRAKRTFIDEVSANRPGMIAVPLFASYKQNVGSDMRSFIDELLVRNYDLQTCRYGYNIYRIRNMIK